MFKKVISSQSFSRLHALYAGSYSSLWPDWAVLMKKVAYQPDKISEIFRETQASICERAKTAGSNELRESGDEMDSILGRLLFKVQAKMLDVYCPVLSSDADFSLELSDNMQHFFDLRRVARKGWTRAVPAFHAGIGTDVETVDQHCVKTAWISSMLCSESSEHVFLMGLIHDHAELIVGDLTPNEVSNRTEKNALERKVYLELVDSSDIPVTSKNAFKQAFAECMERQSVESLWVHVADKIDMALQAHAYEERYHLDLQEFYDSAEEDIVDSLNMITSKKICDI